jgi:hypothetical protein
MDYRAPGFRQPEQFGVSLDGIFNAYMQNKAQQAAEGGQRLANGGFSNAEATPDRMAAAAQPAPQGPMQPGQAPMEDPLIGSIRSYIDRKKSGADLDRRFKESEIAKNNRGPAGERPSQPGQPGGVASGGKMLPPASVLALNEGAAVARMLPEVSAALQEAESIMGPAAGRAGSANPYDTKAQTVDARFRTASQAFGKFMEGGVLRKEDEEKYRKMFPQLSDTPDVARNKLAIVQRMLGQKYESDKGALGGSGYDVSGFGNLQIPDSLFGGGAGGNVRVTNGRESFLIDPSDEAAAIADGFKRAP